MTPAPIPRGIEVLVRKAAVDPEFKDLLLAKRAEAAKEIGLELEPAEILMLQSLSAEQLEKTIAGTQVPEEHRRVFLGKAAVAMLGVLGVTSIIACTMGCRIDRPPEKQKEKPEEKEKQPQPISHGVRPDNPKEPGRKE